MIKFSEVNPISRRDSLFIQKEISSVIKKKDFILGKYVALFEKNFSKLSKIKYSIGCASGTDALILALKSLNLDKNDEVVIPGMSYISTALSVILNNNKLIFADIDPNTGLMSINDVLKKINKNTKVIMPVNLYGQKFNLEKLRKFIGKKIKIIEDSAQSHFAYSCFYCTKKNPLRCCKNKRNEKFADISCYSFYPSKNLGAYGDGGLISTNNKSIYKKILALRNLGSTRKNIHEFIGLNSRLDTIQSVVLNRKLRSIYKLNDKRRKIANYYDAMLEKINEIEITKTNPGSSRHLYVVRTAKRNKLLNYLVKKKISCQVHYPYSLNKLPAIKKRIKKKVILKNAENWSNQCLSLPLHPNLKLIEIKKIIKEIEIFFDRY